MNEHMAIETIETSTLDEFWEWVAPEGKLAKKLKRPIYRGQGDASWHLTPSAFREDIIVKYGKVGERYYRTEQVILFEFPLILDFLHYLDEQGEVVPFDSNEFRDSMDYPSFMERKVSLREHSST